MKLTSLMTTHLETLQGEEYKDYFHLDLSLELSKSVAVDIETDGLHKGCNITSFSVTYPSGESEFFDSNDIRMRTKLQYYISYYTTVWHNSNFDLRVLKDLGYKVPIPGKYHDTMLMAYVLDPNRRGSLSLSKLAPMVGRVKVEVSDNDLLTENIGKSDIWRKRNISDTEITMELYKLFRLEILKDNRLLHHYVTIDLPMSMIIREMEEQGFYLDHHKLTVINDKYSKEYKDTLSKIHKYYTEVNLGVIERKSYAKSLELKDYRLEPLFCPIDADAPYGDYYNTMVSEKSGKVIKAKGTYLYEKIAPYNPKSTDHNVRVLQKEGWVIDKNTKRTPSGKVKLDDEVINEIDTPLANLLSSLSKSSKVTSTYTLPYLRSGEYLPEHGLLRLNGRFNQTQTRTRRLSSSNPNLQNIPGKGEVRELFVGKPGYQLIGGDDSAIEARIFADLLSVQANDNRLVELFSNPDLDFHMENAINWNLVHLASKETGEDAEELIKGYREGSVTKSNPTMKKARDTEKTCLYGLAYGAGASKLGNGDLELGNRIISYIDTGMPGLNQCKRSVWEHCRQRDGYIYNFFGARGYYPYINNERDLRLRSYSERQSFNFVIQSTSYSRMVTRMLIAYPMVKRYNGSIAGMIHDEYLIYVPKENAKELCSKLTNIFSDKSSLFKCPVEFKFKELNSWAEQK